MVKLKQLLEIEAISFISIAAVVSMVFLVRNYQNNPQNFQVLTPASENKNAQADTIPTVTPVPKEEMTSQLSPDGTKNVRMKTTYNSNDTTTYTFSTADSSGENEQNIYTTTLDESEKMTIPFNTWSPDNTYFFILKNGKEALVFNASGTSFGNDEQYLNATDVFDQKNTGNNVDAVTGWAAENLIIINTKTAENTKGPSYWFEVPSKAVIRLSTEF